MKQYRNAYFIGIGGIGMSAIARYCLKKGLSVAGYDRTPSDITEALRTEGADVHYDDDASRIPSDAGSTIVIYTPAVPADFGELEYVRSHGYKVVKRSEMLGVIAKDQHCLAVAGTHGKTTTSTLTAHIFTESGEGCSAFLGGISANYGSNLLISDNPVIVAEADEFDRSFHRLFPDIAAITAMDPDHLDIYGTEEAYCEAFRVFASQVSRFLILKKGLPITPEDTRARIYTYHLDEPGADFRAENIRLQQAGRFSFDLVYPSGKISGILCGVPGILNVENSVAAAAIALLWGIAPEKVAAAIGSFRGAARRLDIRYDDGRTVYLDDYAHHPRELSSAITSIRGMFPGRKLTAVFQPHLYSRTRDFADGFARALSAVDKLIMLDIYPAREEPIPGVDSKMILDKVTAPEKVLLPKEALVEYLRNEELQVLVTFGAGNIDRLVAPIAEMLNHRR